MADRRVTKLVDLHGGRQGTFVEKVTENEDGTRIQPDPDADADRVCRVKFFEEVDMHKSPIRWLKSFFNMVDPVVTQTKFPEEAVYQISLDGATVGQPRRVCIIEEDQNGDSPFWDSVGKKREKQISKIQKERKRAEGDADKERLKNFGQDEKESEDSDYKKRGNRRTPGDHGLEGYGAEEDF